MTLIRHNAEVELVCDACDTAPAGPMPAEDFEILLEDAKAQGWRASRSDGDWLHRCPACISFKNPIPGKPSLTAGLFGETLPIRRKPR